jgi:purine-nucleoside phosphorylase
MVNLNAKYKELIDYIYSQAPFTPEISLILGSGLGNFAESINIVKDLSSEEIPGYPPSTVEGHSGRIYFGEYSGKKIILFKGRLHFYEGYTLSQCVLPVFITYKFGCRKLIITNAAGGANPDYKPGDLMLARSVNGLMIKKELTELIGLASVEAKNHMTDFPSKEQDEIIRRAAEEEKIELREGAYWYNKGPAYETPAEVRMAHYSGCDAVGMSTVHEAVYAAHLGIKTSVISCITNYGSGVTKNKLNHAEVIETADLISARFERLIKKIIELS